jgi:hypothetical protein
MEIIFELEDNDFEYSFEPDFRVQSNSSDETQVSWRLSNSKPPRNMAVLFPEFSTEGTIYTIAPDGDDV